ncbi:intraflagellar transporter 52 [Thecamonas trahens ATCC 50062]|uniref:Intraflagellar transporter 52 n=1 Tax=Thecamonas trahens ATCC 50062 TaxID=461836 RepID=A0A0L0DJZ3_THETB|nr:intraflagellar transporter 52 [Thecamonas trahens ATCC 50062]KNC52545.1 intraflagellar transporter 52 [Thecamonas trahens ATCC 50062]|eukprot:XP_013755336.1 intraflagellar transporter 52 [Thecamonas trahens ATCC 50062]
MSQPPTLVVNTTKDEAATVTSATHTKFLAALSAHYTVKENTRGLSEALQGCGGVLLGGPRKRFSKTELDALRAAVARGATVVVLLGEGGEKAAGTNINYLLEEFGMRVNPDAVVATAYSGECRHPKEVYVADGVLNRVLPRVPFVYPRGASINVEPPAAPLLASGEASYPLNQPIAARVSVGSAGGQILAIASIDMISDSWLARVPANAEVLDGLVKVLAGELALNKVDEENPDVSPPYLVPDTEALAVRLRSCLEDADPLPAAFEELFELEPVGLDLDLLPAVSDLFVELSVKDEPLTLIPPELEVPLPPLQPALFPPELRGAKPPALELFDLDGAFATERVRLAQLTNNCTAGDENADELEYYVRACGDVLGMPVTNKDTGAPRSGKQILQEVLFKLVKFKNRI